MRSLVWFWKCYEAVFALANNAAIGNQPPLATANASRSRVYYLKRPHQRKTDEVPDEMDSSGSTHGLPRNHIVTGIAIVAGSRTDPSGHEAVCALPRSSELISSVAYAKTLSSTAWLCRYFVELSNIPKSRQFDLSVVRRWGPV